jgi:hypothetical protein
MGWKSMLESAGVKFDDEAKEMPAEKNNEAGAAGENGDPKKKKDVDQEKKQEEENQPQKKADPASGNIS